MHLPVAAFSNKIYAYYLQELHHPNTDIIPLCFQPQNGLPFTLYILLRAKEIWPWWAATPGAIGSFH